MAFGETAIAWAVKKLADSALGAWLRPTLDKRIRKTVELWRVGLPLELQEHDLWPAALLNLEAGAGSTADARSALRAALTQGFPDERHWLDALVERWKELHASGGVAFLSMPEENALPHLKVLARSLQRVCAQDPNLALPALLAASLEVGFGQVQVERAHAEIERAKAAINGGNRDVGWDILATLRSRRWDALSGRERYRVLALQAHVLMRRGQIPEAAALFIESASYQPDDDQAKAGLALGRLFLGQTEEAFAIAKDVLGRTANSMAGSVFVMSARDMDAEQIEHALPPSLLRDVDVARHLSTRARALGDFMRAERHARAALAAASDQPEAQAELGRVLLQSVVAGLTDEPTSLAPEIRHRVEEAKNLLTMAIANTAAPQDVAQLRLDRSVAHDVLRDGKSAEADLREAYALAPTFPPLAIRVAESRRSAGDIQGALEVLEGVRATRPRPCCELNSCGTSGRRRHFGMPYARSRV
jgi:tetratricopeptide (TPR) repeat protein